MGFNVFLTKNKNKNKSHFSAFLYNAEACPYVHVNQKFHFEVNKNCSCSKINEVKLIDE